MYLITPLRLNFRYNPSKHVGELRDRLVGGIFEDCRGTFQARITTNSEQGLRSIRREIRKHLNLCWFISDDGGKAKLEDFDLVYSCTQAEKDGSLWIRDGERTSNLKPTNGELFIDEARWLIANLDATNVTKARAAEATSQLKEMMKRFGIEAVGKIAVTVLPDKSGYDLELDFPAAANIG